MSERKIWTIAFRKPRANRFQRVTDWCGTWSEAVEMSGRFVKLNPEMQCYYVTTAEYEARDAIELPKRVARGEISQDYADSLMADHGNILTDDTRKRVRMLNTGKLPDELKAHGEKCICLDCFAEIGRKAAEQQAAEKVEAPSLNGKPLRTADGVPITENLAVWDYDLNPGRITLWTKSGDYMPNARYGWDGWFYVIGRNGERALMNAERVCSRHPFTRKRASDVL